MKLLRIDKKGRFNIRIYAKYVGLSNNQYRVVRGFLNPDDDMVPVDAFLDISGIVYTRSRSVDAATTIQALHAYSSKDKNRFLRTQKYLNKNGLRVTVPNNTWPQEKKNSFFAFGKKDRTTAL